MLEMSQMLGNAKIVHRSLQTNLKYSLVVIANS